MQPKDKPKFFKTLADSLDVYGAPCTPGAAEMWFAVLESSELDAVLRAFKTHMRNPQFGRFAPKPADIVREIEEFLPEHMRGAI